MQTDSVEKAAGIGAIGLWAALHGWLGWLVVLYAVCMMLDWVTGTVLAIKNGVWSSHKARQGLWHKRWKHYNDFCQCVDRYPAWIDIKSYFRTYASF